MANCLKILSVCQIIAVLSCFGQTQENNDIQDQDIELFLSNIEKEIELMNNIDVDDITGYINDAKILKKQIDMEKRKGKSTDSDILESLAKQLNAKKEEIRKELANLRRVKAKNSADAVILPPKTDPTGSIVGLNCPKRKKNIMATRIQQTSETDPED